jgi:integrase
MRRKQPLTCTDALRRDTVATIEKRIQTAGKAPRYRVRWWASDKQRSKTFDRWEDARRFKAMLEGDLANGTYIDPKSGSLTVEDYAKRWWETIVDLRPSTKDRVGLAMRHVIAEFGTLPLNGVTHQHITAWVAASSKGYAPASVRKNAFTLKRILDSAVNEGLIKANPMKGVRLPAEPHHEQRYLDREQVSELLAGINPRYRVMALLAIYGGFRFGELCALRRSSVDLSKNTVRVSHTLVDLNGTLTFGPPKTKTSVRTVTLPRSIMVELGQHMDIAVRAEADALLFTFPGGAALRRAWFRQRVWLPAIESAGLEGLRFHDLRHTFVSLWVALGRNAKEVSRVAGHSSVAFTLDRYGHLYETDDDGLADALDRLLA